VRNPAPRALPEHVWAEDLEKSSSQLAFEIRKCSKNGNLDRMSALENLRAEKEGLNTLSLSLSPNLIPNPSPNPSGFDYEIRASQESGIDEAYLTPNP